MTIKESTFFPDFLSPQEVIDDINEAFANKTVKEKYLTTSFVLRKKDFQLLDEQKKVREESE